MKLKDKVAIVTGAGSGIGKAIAIRFAQEGAKVIIADINLGAAQETADDIINLNRESLAIKMDVTKKEEINSMIEKAIEHFGQVDILVNNAGINLPSN